MEHRCCEDKWHEPKVDERAGHDFHDSCIRCDVMSLVNSKGMDCYRRLKHDLHSGEPCRLTDPCLQ